MDMSDSAFELHIALTRAYQRIESQGGLLRIKLCRNRNNKQLSVTICCPERTTYCLDDDQLKQLKSLGSCDKRKWGELLTKVETGHGEIEVDVTPSSNARSVRIAVVTTYRILEGR
ncbi:hypothetical protein [Lacipirellula sp.]|uniref:hypothetical protein n=1 Tax=Lacipirellula sp. TaxID=2691419 RepID=UPI003D0D6BFB